MVPPPAPRALRRRVLRRGPVLLPPRAREHEAHHGRFLPVDPQARGIADPYVYVEDRPTVRTDPGGRIGIGFSPVDVLSDAFDGASLGAGYAFAGGAIAGFVAAGPAGCVAAGGKVGTDAAVGGGVAGATVGDG